MARAAADVGGRAVREQRAHEPLAPEQLDRAICRGEPEPRMTLPCARVQLRHGEAALAIDELHDRPALRGRARTGGKRDPVIARSLHENESHSHLGRVEAARRTPRYAHGTRMQARLLALFVLGAASAVIGASVATTAQSPVATANAYAIAIVVPGQPGSSAGACRRRARRWPPRRTPSRYLADGSIARTGALSTSVASRTGGTPVAHAVTDVLTGSLQRRDHVGERRRPREVDSGVQRRRRLRRAGTRRPRAAGRAGAEPARRARRLGFSSRSSRRSRRRRCRLEGCARHGDGAPRHAHGGARGAAARHGDPGGARRRGRRSPYRRRRRRSRRRPCRRADRAPRPEQAEAAAAEAARAHRCAAGLRNPIIRPLPTDIHAPLSPSGTSSRSSGLRRSRTPTARRGQPSPGITARTSSLRSERRFFAVADGTVFSVGWNDIGGFRFWLRDRQGNQFYFAHLSAFSPLAVDGNEVRAGQVIGFVGNTGDAQDAVPPALRDSPGLAVADGLRRRRACVPVPDRVEEARGHSLAAGRLGAARTADRQRPRPGAFLLGASGHSGASGLEPGSLQRARGRAPATADGSALGAG